MATDINDLAIEDDGICSRAAADNLSRVSEAVVAFQFWF